MSHLSLTLLGDAVVARDNVIITRFRSDKARGLLLYLVLESDRAHTRDFLGGMFWGGQTEAEARHNVSQAIFYLQSALGKETVGQVLDITRTTIQFNPESETEIDAQEFLDLLRTCETHPHRRIQVCAACIARLERAAALYRGELLAQFILDDCPAFDEWLLVQREKFQRLAISAFGNITAYYEAQGAAGYEQTLRCARRQIELEPWREEPYRVVMRTLAAQNQKDAALVEYHTLANILNQELGLDPSPETKALYHHIRSSNRGPVVGDQSPVSSLQSPISNLQSPFPIFRTNLPLNPTPLVGRAAELDDLTEILDRADCRLLTLIGPGGIGKTRLALELASSHQIAFPGGVYFINLADVPAPELIPGAIGEALQFRFDNARSPAEQIRAHLRTLEHDLLLVTDNMEHLLGGTELLDEILKYAAHVTIIATSRERLNLPGEWLFEVDGLATPAVIPDPLPGDWDGVDAVQLFIRCAARAGAAPETWREEERRAVMRVTQLVEGMPLAIELAAAWVRTLGPIEIASEIEKGLNLLATNMRHIPKRHASMRAVSEYSWLLLSPAEQTVFARLSVFRGGVSGQAARHITGASLPVLASLIDKSILKRTAAGRYRMHELVRHFAAEKLARSDASGLQETTETQTRHMRFYMAYLAERQHSQNGSQARQVMGELHRDWENVRSAWECAVRQGDVDALQGAHGALAGFYQAAGWLQEEETVLKETLDRLSRQKDLPATRLESELNAQLAHCYLQMGLYPQAVHAAQQAIALGDAAGTITGHAMGEWLWGTALLPHMSDQSSMEHLEKALVLARRANLPVLEARILLSMSDRAQAPGDMPDAEVQLTRALELAESNDEQRLTSVVLTSLARLANHQGDLSRAQDLLQRALSLLQQIGHPIGELRIYLNLGTLAVFQYKLDQARDWYARAAAVAAEINSQSLWMRILVNLAGSKWVAGEYEQARNDYQRALAHTRVLSDSWVATNSMFGLISIELAVGDTERAMEYARRLHDIVSALRDEHEMAYTEQLQAQIYETQQDIPRAEALYHSAMQVFIAKDNGDFVLRCRAGLVRCAMARGELAQARALAVDVVESLDAKLPLLHAQPLKLYLTCYRALSECGDPRAPEILEKAHTLLMGQASMIQDNQTRRSFVENVPWHRELVREWENGVGASKKSGES